MQKLSDFRLVPGQLVQLKIQADEGVRQIQTTLVGFVKNHHVFVASFKSPVKLRPGLKMTARLPLGDGFCQFDTVLDVLPVAPLSLIALRYPSEVKRQKIRASERIDVNLPVNLVNTSTLTEVVAVGELADLSLNGAKLSLPEAIASVGDGLTLSFLLSIGAIQRSVKLQAVVRARLERSTREIEESLPAIYGVEFVNVDEADLIILTAYIYRNMAALP